MTVLHLSTYILVLTLCGSEMSRQIKVGGYAYAWSGLDRVPELSGPHPFKHVLVPTLSV